MRCVSLIVVGFWLGVAWAQEDWSDAERDPAALPSSVVKRVYPGGADEEDLQVRKRLPEAPLKTDARSIQREVYKALYNQELRNETPETMEE